MTNFEYYMDEVLAIVDDGEDLAVVDDKPIACSDTECGVCEFGDICCTSGAIAWLYAEHIDKPTLTKKERMFCELVETGYIARDSDGKLFYFKYMPISHTSTINGHYWSAADMDMTVEIHVIDCLQDGFIFVKGDDGKPWNVEELLKLEYADGDLSVSQIKEKDN